MANVLLVDDSRDMREVVAEMLKVHGHRVLTAESAEEALNQMRTVKPDAVVVDQRLPGMTGMELLHQLRNDPVLSGISVVLCSGDDRHRDAARDAGAADFWLKGSEAMFDGVARLTEKLRPKT